MSEELCWKCEEWMISHGITKCPPDHCHHEPKEKPKCWCEGEGEHRIQKFCTPYNYLGGRRYYTMMPVEKAKFCPDCGRKLED
jgi:hypothetical protein